MRTKRINSQNISSGARRIDGKFFLNEDSLYSAVLEDNKNKCIPLSQVAEVFNPSIFKRQFCQNTERAVMYFQSSDVPSLSEYSSVFINKKQAESLRTLVSENQILVTGFGTIGNVRLVSKLQEGVCYANNVCRITAKSPNFYGFIYAFMASKYAKAQLNKNASGSVVRFIEAPGIKRTLVPIVSESKQQEIHNLIVESANLRVKANRLLEEAKILLEKEINVHFQKELFRVGCNNIKDIFFSLQCRLDPPALISDGVETINKLKSKGVAFKALSECNAYVYRPGIFKRNYVEKGYPYIKGSELFDNNPFLRCQYLSKTKTPFVEQMKLRENQILITCAGSCGQIKLITKEFEDKGAIGSQDIIRVEAKDSLFTTEYLFIYFQIPFVFDYIQSMKYGSVIERIEPFHVESIPIFVPSKEVSQEITDKINTYKKNMYVAFIKENQAISLVEKEIESWQQS